MTTFLDDLILTTRGALNFICRLSALLLSKIKVWEWIFFENEVSWNENSEICILRAEILAKNKAENVKFFLKKKLERGGEHMNGALMINW